MAFTSKSFNRYMLTYYTPASGVVEATLHLYLDANFQGALGFYKDGTSLPPNSADGAGRIFLNFHTSHFANIIEILREESPLSVVLNSTSLRGHIISGHEPVGEEEAK